MHLGAAIGVLLSSLVCSSIAVSMAIAAWINSRFESCPRDAYLIAV